MAGWSPGAEFLAESRAAGLDMEAGASGGSPPEDGRQASATKASDESESAIYEEKLAKLQKYLPFLNSTIARLESSKDKVRASQLSKMKNLQQILTSSRQRMKIDTLDRCEQVLKKLEEKLKFPIPQDNSEASSSKESVKTEPEEVVESPASPPQLDLNPPKSTPIIIPVERCATVERDFSKAEQETTLEASRGRLKGLMLKNEPKQTSSVSSTVTPPAQIPGLDLLFPRKDPEKSIQSSRDVNLQSSSETETRTQSEIASRPATLEEWKVLESLPKSRGGINEWPASRVDVDERRLNRDIDFRPLRRDIDERQLSESEPHRNQIQAGLSQTSMFQPTQGHTLPAPSLLPRFMPTHNLGYSPTTCSSSQEFQRSSDKGHLEGNTLHQGAPTQLASSKIRGSTPLLPSPVLEQMGHSSSQSRYPVPQRESHGGPRKTPLLPAPKTFQNSFALSEFERRNVPSTQQSPKMHTIPSTEANKPSARERIMQRIDEVEKLGTSSGGALRKLKSDILERGVRRSTEIDAGTSDEGCMRSDLMPRKVDPRLEREQRRSSMEEEALKARMVPRIPPLIPSEPSGFGSNILPPNLSSFSASSVAFGGNLSRSAQWNQSHVTSRSMYQSQSVVNTYQWQSTCTVKQTTAHDLGLRYQPRSRHGKGTHFSQPERSLPSSTSAPCEERNIHKEAERNARMPCVKPIDERMDPRNLDPRRKEKGKDKEDKDYSSPLNSLYIHDKGSKTGQGYGLQSYKIPKRLKDHSPPQESSQTTKSITMDPRLALTRDPRLSKVLTRQPSPDFDKESPLIADCEAETGQEQPSGISARGTSESRKNYDTTLHGKPGHQITTRSQSLSTERDEDISDPISASSLSWKTVTHAEVCVDNERYSPSRPGSISPSHVKSRCNSPEDSEKSREKSCQQSGSASKSREKDSGRTSRSREKSPLHSQKRNRSTSKAHSRERSRSRSRSRVRERSISSSYGRSRGRGQSWSRSRSRSRGKSRARSLRRRDKSRGRSSSRTRCKSRGRSSSQTRSKSRARSTSRNRGKSRERSTSRSRGRDSSKSQYRSRDRSTSRSRGKSRGRSTSRSRCRSRGRSPSRTRGRRSLSRGRRRSRIRSISKDKERSPSRSRGRAGSRNKSPSRSIAVPLEGSSSLSKLQSKEESYKSRRKHDCSQSPCGGKESPGFSRERRSRKSRTWSQSSDSDKNSESLSRKESPSPDRGHTRRRKNRHQSRKRSVSSDSNHSRDLSSIRSLSSTGKSRKHSKSRDLSSRLCESGKRSLSRESLKNQRKSTTSSRSSSCSGRSSPLFPKERSQSKSPYRNQDFDSLLKKDITLDVEIPQSSGDRTDISTTMAQSVQRDVVVSSSLNVSEGECKLSSSSDVTIDVPTSTSENIPDVGKPDIASSSEISVGVSSGTVAQASSTSKQEGDSSDAGNIIFGLIKSIAGKDILNFLASTLPEDKRLKVLQLLKEGSQESKDNEEAGSNDCTPSTSAVSAANISNDQVNENSSVPSVISPVTPKRPNVKGKKKPKGKFKTLQDPSTSVSQKKSKITVERSEKQKRKRNELEKLHEDIREMFISEEVVHATGQRSCRMRKEAKEIPVTASHRPSSSDEKLKTSSQVDFLDDSPSKTQISDSSISDFQPVDSKRKKIIKYSSESDDDTQANKLMRPDEDAIEATLKNISKMSFLESESESELLPRVVLEDMQPSRPPRRNVARRGRRIAPLSRDQVKGNEDDYTLTYEVDGDDEEEESRVEDKDMSQIDTSNIIHVEGAGSKLTRNRLKKLKDPEQNLDCKSKKKRPFYGYKEVSESESDTSKTSESFIGKSDVSGVFDSSPSPVKKRRKLRKPQNISKNITKQKQIIEHIALDDDVDVEVLEGSFDGVSHIRLVHENIPLSPSGDIIPTDIQRKQEANICVPKSSDVELHEAPSMSRIINISPSKEKSGIESEESHLKNYEFHKDLTYTISVENKRVSCKICNYAGKPIVNHYVSCHPMEEVLISRLPTSLAENLKAEATTHNQDLQVLKTKYHVNKRSTGPLKCRVCNTVALSTLRLYEHVSSHTGEFRFSCTQCPYKTAQRVTMKSHRKSRHHKSKVKDLCQSFSPEAVVNMKVLFAYICSECNFFQLLESNIKKHVQSYHPSTAHVIRICISEEVSLESKDLAIGVDESDQLVVGSIENDHLSEASGIVSASLTVNKIPSEAESVENPTKSLPMDKDIAPPDPSSKGSRTSPLDMSIFIGSDHPSEDDSEVEQKRRKLLEDAEEKIRGRPKIRGSISEKLSQRLESEPLPSLVGTIASCSTSNMYEENDVTDHDSESSSFEKESSGKCYLKTTGGRAASKSSDPSEKRFTRSTSRTSVATTDSEITGTASSEVPDEIKAPLPVSILYDTIQRMQETIQYSGPSLSPISSLTSPSENSSLSKFVLKKGAVKVGLVEAKNFNQTQDVIFICSFPDCTFSSGQTFVFQEHIDKHSRKPVSAPCSICDDGGNILRDLPSSFNHLLKYHLYEVDMKDVGEGSSRPPSIPLDSSQASVLRKPSLIRPRKLPGDILSQSDKTSKSQDFEDHPNIGASQLPSLVISSVVSLSKDHTPDGIPLLANTSDTVTHSHQTGSKSSPAQSSCPPSFKFTTQFKKDQESLQEMMKFEKVCHLFKCFGQHCSFSTNLKEFFADHYHKHLSKELHQFLRATSESFQWQKCIYCGELKGSGKDLANHILLYHDILKFQCSGCFYRAASVASVAYHQQTSHKSKVVVIECHQSPKATLDRGSHRLQVPQIDQIQVYKCFQDSGRGQCGTIYVSPKSFLSHQQSLHPSDKIFYCCECGSGYDSSPKLICHYSTSHSYRMYHCLYCAKASETIEEISCHMCLDHPDKQMQVAARIPLAKLESIEDTIQLPSGVLIGLINLGNELSNHPTISAKDIETDFNNDPLFSDREPSLPCTSYDIGANSAWLPKSQSDFPSLQKPHGNKNLEDERVSNEITQLSINENLEPYSTSKISESDGKQNNHNSRVVDDDVSQKDGGAIGLSGLSLYKCGYLGCSFKADTEALFKEHILSCMQAHTTVTLSCPHCSKVCRNLSVLMEHLPKHGVPRFMCGLCDDFRTTHQNSALRHAKDRHKLLSDSVRFQPNPLREEPGTSPFIFCAKENTSKRLKTKGQNATQSKTSFGPSDRDMLPLSAVFTSNAICSVCQYSTKVRSNMIRHLDQHALGCEPSPVPVLNPVPCLERNEKMFDTMTNHAISSTIHVRRDSNAIKVTNEPRFVPENQRFACCAPACNQISSDDAMLRHHIRGLHQEILVYKCPHCPDSDSDCKQPIFLEKLGSHLKMHGSRLYSCLSCSYYHYHRHIVERHTGEKHPDQKLIRIVREPKPDGPIDMENVVNDESEIMGAECTYVCTLCSFKGFRVQVIAHLALVHRINALFKCSFCNFRANARSRFSSHFAKSHPNEKESVIEVVQKVKVEKTSDETPQPNSETPAPPPPPPIVAPLSFDSTPLWLRNSPRVRHLRGILFEENGLKPKELEHSDTKSIEGPRFKRPIQSSIDNMQSSKREKKDALSCVKCLMKFTFSQEEDYRQHIRSHFPNSDESRFKCAECSKTFSKYDDVASHIRKEHKQNITAKDLLDLHSEESINLDIDHQLFEPGPSSESSESLQSIFSSPTGDFVVTPTKSIENSAMSSPSKSHFVNKRKSPRTSPATLSSAPNDCSLAQRIKSNAAVTRNKSPVKGIKPLYVVSAVEPKSVTQEETNQPVQEVPATLPVQENSEDQGEILVQQKPLLRDPLDNDDVDLEVDESALELDIEEVDDEEVGLEETVPRNVGSSSVLEKESVSSKPTNVLNRGMECKYKISHGCKFVSKSKVESSYHEKKHWEVQPLKCGHCNYQAVRESYIRMHSVKKHPDLPVQLIKNKLPEVPTILSLARQQTKKSSTGTSPKTNIVSSEKRAEEIMKIAELADDEEIFKSVNMLRCGFCRLRETSLSRLFSHWQTSHKNNTTLLENTPDGKRLVPFKFREVKLGDHEKLTMAFRCALCSSKGTIKLLAEHYPSRHPGEKIKISELIHNRVQCVLCPRQLSSKTALNSHFSSAHPGEAVGCVKVTAHDTSDDLDRCMGCLYCLEPVRTASDMQDHHLNFHSHLDPKFIELDTPESSKPISSENIYAECSQSDVDTSGHSVVCTANASRPSVILSVRSVSQEDLPHVPDVSIDLPPVSSTVVKRAVARKSTSKVRAVATDGKVRKAANDHPAQHSTSDSDTNSVDGYCRSLDETAVSCLYDD